MSKFLDLQGTRKFLSNIKDYITNFKHNHSASEITSGTLDADRIPNLNASKITEGTIDIARLPAGALERLVTVADQTARFTLTTSNVQLGDTVKQLDTGVMYIVIDTGNLNNANGYMEYTAGTATSVPWSGVTDKPSIPTKTSDLTNDSHVSITTSADTTSTDTLEQGDSFTVIDSVTRDTNGHVTTVNTKTLTLPDICEEQYLKMVNDPDELETLLEKDSISPSDMINGWYKYYHAVDMMTDPNIKLYKKAWRYNEQTNAIENPIDIWGLNALISPKKYDHYTLKVKVQAIERESQYDNSADSFEIICAYMIDEHGHEHTLSLVRGGISDSDHYPGIDGWDSRRFCMMYDDGYQIIHTVQDFKDSLNTYLEWDNPAHIQVQRNGSTLIISASEQNSDVMSASVTFEIPDYQGVQYKEMYDNIRYMLSNPCQIGIGLCGQAGSFIIEEATGLYDTDDIYYTPEDQIYSYDSTEGEYVLTDRKVSDEVKDGTRVYNEETGKSFYYIDGRADVIGVSLPISDKKLGNESNRLKAVYSDTYYLGTTEFGDVVTHDASDFASASHTHGNITNGGKIGSTANKPLITTTDGEITTGSFGTSANTFCEGNDSRLSDARTPLSHNHSASDVSGLSTVATTGSYTDLTNKPDIPTVNNATLTIQKNGTTVNTFTANSSSNVTANITVPTKTSDLTNDSHTEITLETDTTSTATAVSGGTFTVIDTVSRDSNGHVTKVNTKTITLPSDNNTDTLVNQSVSSANNTYPVLMTPTADADTNQGAKESIFASGVKINPSTNTLSASTVNSNNYLINNNPLNKKYVTIDTNQTITGAKEFTQIIDGDISGNADTCTEYYMYMVNNADDLATMLNYDPLTLSDVFNTWYRFAHYRENGQFNLSNYNDNATVKADMEAWSYNESDNSIHNRRNTESFVGFISEKKYYNYTLKIKAYTNSSNPDDDRYAIICAFMTDSNGVEHTISLLRSGNRGQSGNEAYRFALVYDYYNPTSVILASGNDQLSIFTFWDEYAHIQVQRNGSTLICTTSEQNSDDMTATFTYSIPTEQGTLSNEAYANIRYMLSNKSQVGFGMQSQPGDFILEDTTGLFNSNDIYYTVTDQIYSYDDDTNSYVLTNRKVSDEIKDGTRVYNEVLGKSFYYTESRGDVIGLSVEALNRTYASNTSVENLSNTLATVATSGSYNDLTDKPLTMTPSSHTHGNITNDGKVGSTANKPLITTTNGVVTTGSFGTTANTFCEGNDSRLSDARTPLSHNHSASEITSGTLDSARIPNLDASKITSGTIDIARLPAGALERLVTVADQTARYALTTSNVQLGDTVKQTDTGVMYIVVDTGNLNNANGYMEYTAGSATSVPWSGVTGKPSDFNPSSHTHGNISNDGKLGTASRVVITDSNKAVDVSSVTSTELGYLSGATSSLQTQINGKADDNSVVHTTGNESISGTKSFNSDLNLNYAVTDVDDIVDSIPGTGNSDDYVHLTGNETVNGVKSFPDGIVANVSGTCSRDGDGNTITSTYGKLASNQTWSGENTTHNIKPEVNATYSLGNASYRWNSVYANNYYYGTTAFTDKFVTTDTQQTITAIKTFDNRIKINSVIDSYCQSITDVTENPQEVKYKDIIRIWNNVADIYNAGLQFSQLTDGTLRLQLINFGYTTEGGAYQNRINFDSSRNGEWNFSPNNNNGSLGTSANKWKSVYADSYYYGTTSFTDKFVTTDTGQTITANKNIKNGNPAFVLLNDQINKGVAPSSDKNMMLYFRDNNNSELGRLLYRAYSDGTRQMWLAVNDNYTNGELDPNGSNKWNSMYLTIMPNGSSSCNFSVDKVVPNSDASIDLGTSSNRWKSVYANSYYLGTTAFGNIVTHNTNEFATASHTHSASDITSGTIDIARLPQGALDRLITVANQTSRYALTTNDISLGDTVKQLDTGELYIVTDLTNLNNSNGYTIYTAGTATRAYADEDGDNIKTWYGKLNRDQTWTAGNTFTQPICLAGDRTAYILPVHANAGSGIDICTQDYVKPVRIGNWTTSNSVKVLNTSLGYLECRTGTSSDENTVILNAVGTDTQLGTSANKWKTINGLNPGALSLPSEDYVQIDTTNWNTTGTSANRFTPTVHGWLGVQVMSADISDLTGQYIFAGRSTGGDDFYPQGATTTINVNSGQATLMGTVIIPVIANKEYHIRIAINTTQGSSIKARFYPCLGNV